MQYTPRTREEADESRLLEKGEGQFEIVKAEESVSKGGCPMIAVTLKVWDMKGKQGLINDWILLNEQWDWKLRHLADAIGVTDKYEDGLLKVEDLPGKSGVLNIAVKIDKSGKYGPQNSVKEYLVVKNLTPQNTVEKPADTNFPDDDIPF